MSVRQLTIEDAYRELTNVTGVVAVTTDGSGGLTVEHKNARNEIEAVLDPTFSTSSRLTTLFSADD